MKTIFIHADPGILKEFKLPDIKLARRLVGDFDYIHVFSKTKRDLNTQFSRLKGHLRKSGMLWVSWPKSGQLETDLNIKHVIKIGYDHDLVESKTISINGQWSAIRFTHPKDGKVYHNSYGTLKSKG